MLQVANSNALEIVDVSNPASPVHKGSISKRSRRRSPEFSEWAFTYPAITRMS